MYPSPSRTYRTWFLVAALALFVVALIVGFDRGDKCGTALAGGPPNCAATLVAPTVWTVALMISALVCVVAAFVLDLLQRIARQLEEPNVAQ
ncbi:hypothetical protein GCM10029964_105060 [Kibdelosporangium lantanae]